MEDLKNVTYCGLYCRLCSNMSRVPQLATALRDTLAKDGWESYGEYVEPDFKLFWAALGRLSLLEETCPDCRGGCGDPDCAIRVCAVERNVDICPFCEDFPCEHIEALASRYPNLIGDGIHLKSIGIEAWIVEQEQRRDACFCLSDIRFPSRETGDSGDATS